MVDSTQDVAKRVLADLETLLSQGKLQQHQINSIRSELETIARPPPPILARKPIASPSHHPRKKYRAIWAYSGADVDEISFNEGDHLELIEEVSEGWWKGCVARQDGTRGKEGMFPSNYVEVIPETTNSSLIPALPPRQNNIPPAGFNNIPYNPTSPPPPRIPSQMPPYNNQPFPSPPQHGQFNGPAPWQPGVARWSSDGPPQPPPPPPNQFQSPQQPEKMGFYNNQPPMPYGGATPEVYGGNQSSLPQPVVPTEEDRKKHDKMKKFAGRMGETMAGGLAGGIGFGIGSHLF